MWLRWGILLLLFPSLPFSSGRAPVDRPAFSSARAQTADAKSSLLGGRTRSRSRKSIDARTRRARQPAPKTSRPCLWRGHPPLPQHGRPPQRLRLESELDADVRTRVTATHLWARLLLRPVSRCRWRRRRRRKSWRTTPAATSTARCAPAASRPKPARTTSTLRTDRIAVHLSIRTERFTDHALGSLLLQHAQYLPGSRPIPRAAPGVSVRVVPINCGMCDRGRGGWYRAAASLVVHCAKARPRAVR